MQVLTAPANFGHSDCERIVVGAALAQPVLAVTSLAYVAAQTGITVPHDDQKTRYPSFEVGAVHPLEWDAGGNALWVVNQPGNRLVKLEMEGSLG